MIKKAKKNTIGVLANIDYYKNLFYNSSEAIFVADSKTGLLVDVNKVGEKLVGRSREELIGQNRSILHPKNKIKEYTQLFKKHVKQKKGSEFNAEVIKKDGTLVPVSIMAAVMCTNGREVIKGIFSDISKLKNEEEKLKKEIEKTDKYLNLAGAVILALDTDGKIILLNKKGHEVLGYKNGSLLGKNWFNTCVPVNLRKDVYKVFVKLMEGNIKLVEHYDNLIITKDKKEKRIEWFNTIVKNDQGKIIGTLSSGEDITERKEVETKLKESEERFRLIYETATDAIMTLEPPIWNFTSGNPAITKLFGVKSEEEFKKLKPWQASPKYQPDGQLSSVKAKKMIDIAMKKGSNSFEWTHKKINGGEFLTIVTLSRVKLEDKVFLQARVADISEKREAETKLKESEDKFKSVVTNSDNITFIINKKGKFVLSEGRELRALGLKPGQVVGMSALEMYKKYPAIIKGIKDGWKGKTTQKSNVAVDVGNKRPVYFEIFYTPYKNGDNKILGTIGIAENVSAKKLADEKIIEKAEEAMREKDKLSKIVQEIGEGVFVIDEERKLVLSNKAACTLASLKHSENCCAGMKYNEIFKFVYEENEKENKEFIEKVFLTGEEQEVPIFNHHNTNLLGRKGNTTPVSLKTSPLKDKNGKVIGCVVVFKDVKEAREIDKIKSDFISVASHSLRTPISGVKWITDLLLEEKIGKLNKKQRKFLRQIHEANQLSIELVNSLLIISRLESQEELEKKRKKINLFELINKLLLDHAIKIKEKKLKIDLSCDFLRNTLIYLDEEKIIQIFDNIIINSIKYSKDKGKIEISCEKQENGRILFEVKDYGYGIPLKEQKRVFEKFFRGENIRKLNESGTGLGLFITKSLVETLGGKIWFDSIENKGTTFFFYLGNE